jgi:hypothetical protein
MNPKRWADICFFVGFAGVIYAIIGGEWKEDSPKFTQTIAALVVGVILIAGSFVYIYREKRKDKQE